MDKKGKNVSLRVIFLDDQVHAFQIHIKAFGQALWDAVVKHLSMIEADYFDLEYDDTRGIQNWLDREKAILKQLPSADTPLRFLVKFYTPDPALLEDELTRYLYALQVKKDLSTGSLTCSDNTMALLASYVAQAEVGDFPIEEYADHTYLRANNLRYIPNQTEEIEKKIMEYHKQHVGESPAEADINLLDTARKVELYGIRMVPAKDHENVSLNLAISHSGILVFQGLTKINTFSWAKIRKLSFKRKRLLIKLHPENYGYYKDLVEFFFDSRDECKTFWKKCIEHHGFFRCQRVKKLPRNKTRVVSRGSSFRYSGRTQKQLSEFIRESYSGKRPQFERTVSGRISSRSSSVTPKIPAKVSLHNSADLHNTSASSGSHILDQSSLQRHHGNVSDTADIHSESSVSGSRSLNSPKLEHALSQDESPPQQQVPAMIVKEESDQGDVAIVTEQTQHVAEVQGACSYNFTNILNINTNLDEVEVNENYMNVVGTSLSLSSPSANQNANDNDRSQSHESYLSEGYDAEIEQTNSISLPSDLKCSSMDHSDSVSLPSELKGQSIDQSDQSIHSDLSVEDIEELESCLQTISNAGCSELDSIVENVVEPLLSISRSKKIKTDVVPLDTNNVKPQMNLTERAIVDGDRTVGEWVNEYKKVVDNEVVEDADSLVSGTELEVVKVNEEQSGKTIINKNDMSEVKLSKDNGIEPSSCILAAVESKLNAPELNKSDSETLFKSEENNGDLFEDIPYYLHRRHIVGDYERQKETELYTALINALNNQKSGADARSRRSRSMKRAPNLQIEQLKADEIPFQPRSLSLPAKRTVSKSPGRKSPSDHELSKSDKARSRRSKLGHSRSSQSRSPSGNRMIEVVNFHSLPRKDNYSSVDDTASPSEDVDVFTQFTKYRTTSPSFKGDSLSESMELPIESYVAPSPVTDVSADESFGLTQTPSESDSLRGLSEGSMSLTHSSFSINESETSQGSYSLSDINLSRDDIVNEMEKMDSFEGEHKTEKIKLEDLDLPFIDAFDENDIAENQLGYLQMSNITHQSETAKEREEACEKLKEVKNEKIDLTDANSNESKIAHEDDEKYCPYSDIVVTEGVCSYNETEVKVKHEQNKTGLHYSLHRQKSVDMEDLNSARSVIKSPQIKSAKPILKPLDIPPKASWKKTRADDEWESLLQQLKDDEDNSPDDLNPTDLLISINKSRSGTFEFPKQRKPMTVEESEIEELDRLLLETTKFNHSERDSDIYGRYSGYCASGSNMKKSFQHYELSDFSTFKPSDSPTRSTSCSGSSRSLLSSRSDSVVTVSLSHDIEDIQMEDKPICALVYQKDQECRLSASSLSSPRHAIIRRSPSPSRLKEYNSVGHREFKVSGDDSDSDLNKRHSYHGETSESVDAKEKRKRLEPKRVSFHETVEEIATEAYQSSSSSSDDKSGADKESEVGTPDTLESGATSDLCYDGDLSSQNAPDDSANDTNESDVGKTDNDEESEDNVTSDEEFSDRDEEFLKFAQRLSECGKDGAADSGMGDSMTNTTEVSPLEPLNHGKHLHETKTETENIVNGNPVIHVDQLDKQSLQSVENDSSSSDSELAPEKKNKRPSVDPLESLEQLHDSYVSSSEESSEGETIPKLNLSD